MTKQNIFKLLSMLALAAVIGVGCNSQGSNDAGPGKGGKPTPTGVSSEGKEIKLAFVTNNASDFWTIARKGTEKATKEFPNVSVDFKLPSEGTAAEQRTIVDTLLVNGIDGMAISPVSPKDQVDMLNKAAEQTTVVTQDSDAPDSKRVCYVGTDNVQAGREAGKLIKEVLPKGGKIMLFVGKKDAQNAKERIQGIVESLKGSTVTIVDVRTDDTDRVRAKANVSDTLVKNPEITCLVGLWSYNGPAILNAVRDAGKAGKVNIVCFDEEDETLEGVRKGDIFGTIVQQPFEFGYQSIVLLKNIAEGKKDVIPADGKMIVPTLTIKKADVDEFQKKLNVLRGRS